MTDRYEELSALLARDGEAVRLTCLTECRLGHAAHITRAGDLLCDPADADFWNGWRAQSGSPDGLPAVRAGVLCERLYAARRLIVCGGGHISRPVSELGWMLGYEVIVLDDRAEFADPARFPRAARVLCGRFEELLGGTLALRRSDSFVVVTRGHKADEECVGAILAQLDPLYIGMIGSKTKNAAVFDRLRARGFSDDQLAQVHAPIGLAIGAQTPEEIAVAIAAELIAERPGGDNAVLPRALARALAQGEGRLMAAVVRKKGSAPRGVGSRMLFRADGSFEGTVGGGAAEGAVIETARAMLDAPRPLLRTFTMHRGTAAELGLICGGEIDVLLEPIR